MNPHVRREQIAVEKFVRAEYWRLARLHDGRFAHSRAALTGSVSPDGASELASIPAAGGGGQT